jgi:MFS family permease
MLHGIFSSSLNPLTFSLIRDNFSEENRGTANSVLMSANYLSIALSSITIMIINQVGWRGSYAIMGASGLFSAILAFLVIKKAPPVP